MLNNFAFPELLLFNLEKPKATRKSSNTCSCSFLSSKYGKLKNTLLFASRSKSLMSLFVNTLLFNTIFLSFNFSKASRSWRINLFNFINPGSIKYMISLHKFPWVESLRSTKIPSASGLFAILNAKSKEVVDFKLLSLKYLKSSLSTSIATTL